MNILQIAIIVGSLNFVAISLTLWALSLKKVDLQQRLKASRSEAQSRKSKGINQVLQRLTQVMRPVGEMIVRSTEEMSRQEKKLVQAGFRRKDAVALFYATQLACAVFLAVAFLASGYLYQRPVLSVVLCLLGGAGIPDAWLKSQMNARMERIRTGLPDAIDLTLVSMEAGLGLDQALLRVGEEIRTSYPDLADEFHLRNIELNMGQSRQQAFRNLAERTGVPELASLVSILIQTDRFGTSISDALRVFSDSMRTKRRQRAQEQAAKLAVKMIVPMVVFVFPSLFVVVVGPAIIQLMRVFFPALGGN
jgi:tight adherence protein C